MPVRLFFLPEKSTRYVFILDGTFLLGGENGDIIFENSTHFWREYKFELFDVKTLATLAS